MRKNGLQAIVLRDGDELIEVKATDNSQDILLVTRKGMCIRFNETDVRVTAGYPWVSSECGLRMMTKSSECRCRARETVFWWFPRTAWASVL